MTGTEECFLVLHTPAFRGRSSEVWLDSDGAVGNDLLADLPDDAELPWGFQEDGVDMADGDWHMVTVTTHPYRQLKVRAPIRGPHSKAPPCRRRCRPACLLRSLRAVQSTL